VKCCIRTLTAVPEVEALMCELRGATYPGMGVDPGVSPDGMLLVQQGVCSGWFCWCVACVCHVVVVVVPTSKMM